MRTYTAFLLILILGVCSAGCSEPEEGEVAPEEGTWRGIISLNDSTEVPFNFELNREEDSTYSMVIQNGEERIEVLDVEEFTDSLKFTLPVFANYIVVRKGEKEMSGEYVRPDAQNYRLPFRAVFGENLRFKVSGENCCDINEKWRVEFSPDTDEETPAIAYFQQKDTYVEGTFLTETGDYRYLQGALEDDRLQLSAFDGVHIFYFDADIESGQRIKGMFYSGRSHVEPWVAYRDEDFELSDPDSLTYLKEGYESLSFSFPSLDGDTLSLGDPRFSGKPVIVQVMGSWCPNCMDESRYLKSIYNEYHHEGLEIVGLTFERARDKETALKRARKMKDDLRLPYPVLLAGATRDDNAGEALPMLNHIMSFPTSIYLDRNHKVVKIHTGFSGPGTPVYDEFVAKDKSIIEDLLSPRES